MSLDIIIVNFNSGEHLGACLDSVSAHAPGSQTIVVDNASTDGSEQAAARADSGVSLVRNAENVGFGRAVNQALRLTHGETVLILNPDCRLEAGALEPLRHELAMFRDCAVAAPRVLDGDGRVQGSVRGDPTMLTGLFGRTSMLTRLLPNVPVARRNVVTHEPRAEGSFTADWVSGACMLARRESLQAIGGFDERYFLYWEDADLCRRLRARGWTVRYVPASAVVHVGGGSSRSVRAASIRAFHRSAYVYYATHVASGPLARGIAWLLLHLRCGWKLLTV